MTCFDSGGQRLQQAVKVASTSMLGVLMFIFYLYTVSDFGQCHHYSNNKLQIMTQASLFIVTALPGVC